MCFTEEGLTQIYNDEYLANINSKPDYASAVKEVLENCYTVSSDTTEISSIKMYQFATETFSEEYIYEYDNIKSKKDTVSSASGTTLATINYNTAISQYTTPVEFQFDLLGITSSRKFIDEFMKLVVEETDIKLKLYKVTSIFDDVVTDSYTQEIEIKGTEKVEDNNNITNSTEIPKEVILNETGKVTYIYTTTTEANQYDLEVDSVTSWHTKIKQDGTSVTTDTYTFEDDDSSEVPGGKENFYLSTNSSNYFKDNGLYAIETTNGEEGLINSIYNSVIRKNEGSTYYPDYDNYKDYNFSSIKVKKTYSDRKVNNQENKKRLKTGVNAVTDNTDKFVALLKTGKTPIEYESVYGGKVKVGDLLVNGDEMLFKLLDTAYTEEEICNTIGLSTVMKVILQKYSGKDYGVGELNFSIYDLSQITITGDTIEEKIWIALKNAGLSDYAVAGVMGNLYAESGIRTNNLEDSFESKLGYTDATYTAAINNGTYTLAQFISDHNSEDCGAGYGLAQWTWYTRKEGLYKYTKSKGVGIDDEEAQIEYLIAEITGGGPASGHATVQVDEPRKGYSKEDWKNATSVDEATEAFCWIFENPSDPHMQNRINAAQKYYDEYAGRNLTASGNYTGTEGEKMCAAAAKIRNYTIQNGYSYDTAVPDYSEGVLSLWNKRGVCCASYVAWILADSGVVSEEYINSLSFRSSTALGNGLKKIFPQVNEEQMQAGDIIVWPNHHTQMYAGDGYWYNAGGVPVRYSQYDAISYFRNNYGWTEYYILRPVQQ